MKARKYLLIVPLIIFLFIPYFSQTLYALEMPLQVSNAIREMKVKLNDKFSKRELKDVVWGFYKARTDLPSFESACEVKHGFEESFIIFQKALQKNNIESLSFKNVEEYYQEIRYSFQSNRSKFNKCISAMKENDCLPEDLTADLIMEAQMYFTFILLATNISDYNMAKQRNHIFPFCDLN